MKNFEQPNPKTPEQKGSISPEESNRVLNSAEIHGESQEEQSLTPDILAENELFPRHKVTIDDVSIYHSAPFRLEGGRIAAIGYVEQEGKTVVRGFYLSNSQGLWRYLPEYSPNAKGKIGWYAKGYDEASLNLPAELQKSLAEASQSEQVILETPNPDSLLAGTARKTTNSSDATYYHETESKAEDIAGTFKPEIDPSEAMFYVEKLKPSRIKFEHPDDEPDFSAPAEESWEQHSQLYGMVNIEVYPSKNGKHRFMMCRDEQNRVWVGGVETKSPVQSTGVRQSWADVGDLTTPAFEYKSQAGGYQNPDLLGGEKENYADMFKNYNSKIPLIQEYLRAKNLADPNPVVANKKREAELPLGILSEEDEDMVNRAIADAEKHQRRE